ncbi:MAG TPA: PD-(D/E)XK nuclease family protein [Malonomonas sp.]
MPEPVSKLITAAADGALILTANKRLSRHLRTTFDRQMQRSGKTVWPTPQILDFDGWLRRSIADLGEFWRLLDGFPALRLWETLIEKESAGSELELLQQAATARKAQEAYRLLVAYDCRLDAFPLTEDQRVFNRWQQAYRDECRKHQWLDRAELPALIYQAIEAGRLNLPAKVLLTGFDQWGPELEGLRQLQQKLGGQLLDHQPEPFAVTTLQRVACADPHQEVLQAARWTRQLLDQGVTSIGIVVTDLQARRQEIERVFRNQIEPAAALQLDDAEAAFSLSLGAPLLEQGPIHAALEILASGFRLAIDQASFLLRTPYLGGSQLEADSRARLDSRLRSFRQQQVSLKRLRELSMQDDRAPLAAEQFERLHKAAADNREQLPGDWAAEFDRLLLSVGWPGERSLSSREYQQIKAWREKLLPALASLDPVSQPLGRRQALGLLRRMAAETEFQIEAATGPVQVVGLLESAGLDFEHLWVMGVGEDVLPAAARPNPFLPLALQLAKQMPHSGAERELEFARNVIARLKMASPQVIFSYPIRQGDCELRPSPLITDLPLTETQQAAVQDACQRFHAAAPLLLETDDSQGPMLTAERGEGGTAILKDQALCPFRAFAHYRLNSKGFELAQPGLDPLTRGNLLHKVLEYLWRELKEQQQLLALEPVARTQLITDQTARALQDYFAEQVPPAEQILQLEANRLQALVDEWLREVDEVRGSFRVLEQEEVHFEQIGPLKIKTIIDRIDQLEDGSRVILDYKTGAVKLDSLLAERLLEPQLPIYATTSSAEQADAVAFAQVKRGGCKLFGVARDAGMLPKVAGVSGIKQAQELGLQDWLQLLTHWRGQLEQLANDFVAGKAAVDPVDFVAACQFCDLAGLCRIAEAQGIAADREVDA